MALRVLRLRMEKRPLVWRLAANKLYEQSQTADKGWCSSLGFWAKCWQPLTIKWSAMSQNILQGFGLDFTGRTQLNRVSKFYPSCSANFVIRFRGSYGTSVWHDCIIACFMMQTPGIKFCLHLLINFRDQTRFGKTQYTHIAVFISHIVHTMPANISKVELYGNEVKQICN
jgi:hypothetical protein